MTSIKFTSIYRDALGEKDYQLLIDEKVYAFGSSGRVDPVEGCNLIR